MGDRGTHGAPDLAGGRLEKEVILLDTSFLIRALVAVSEQDVALRRLLRAGDDIGISAIAWTEFQCGPVSAAAVDVARHLLGDPIAYTAETCMSQPVVTVNADDTVDDVVATMEKHQIRRVPVVDDRGGCAGIISQADVAWTGRENDVAELVREVSRASTAPSH